MNEHIKTQKISTDIKLYRFKESYLIRFVCLCCLYKRLAQKINLCYDKFIYWKYGIKSENPEYMQNITKKYEKSRRTNRTN